MATKLRHREETVNTQLAILVSRMGVTADAEAILTKGRPDVLFVMRGLRVAVEGKFADHPNAEDVVLSDARGRVAKGIAHIAAAAVYPKALRSTPTSQLETQLSMSRLRFKIVSASGETDWSEGEPSGLMDALRRAQEALAQDDIVEQTAKALSERLEGISQLWSGQAGTCDRLGVLLGMKAPKGETADKAADRRESIARVSALVIANALIFQEQLSMADGRIQPLRKLQKEADPVTAAKGHWHWIWTNVNYVPIFQLGENVVDELPLNNTTIAAFKALLDQAVIICSNQAALRHDLMGRIYHWLLHDAKYLGTYYTSVSAATLLLKLVASEPWSIDFGDPAQLANFKVGDLACGSGTLLMATAEALSDEYIGARARTGRALNATDLQTLHRALMENVLHGYDVLPTAIHLTASTLAMLAPEVSFVRMSLYIMPMGMDGNSPRLGSLDFLSAQKLPTQIAIDHSQAEVIKSGAGTSHIAMAVVPGLDLCVMNPPFVSNRYGNLLFGSLPAERSKLQAELKRVVKEANQKGRPSSATAGLGSVFAALADMYIKPNGRLAFVLPAAVCSGESWAETRTLISKSYHLEMVVSSHDADRPNFSENTALSEVLFIARKLPAAANNTRTTYVNLWRNPRTIHEALDLAERIRRTPPVDVEAEGFASIEGAVKWGEIFTTPAPKGGENWTGALFAQTDLLRAYYRLTVGEIQVPGAPAIAASICRLSDLGALGPDVRRIVDGFKVSVGNESWSTFPAFWNHDSNVVVSPRQAPNGFLHEWQESPRGPKYGTHLWQRAGNILLVSRLRTNTHRILAARFDVNVFGNTWWSFKHSLNENQQKALVLWLNSSLGLLAYFGRRAITEMAWMQMKQPAWESMPVFDVRGLNDGQLAMLATAFDDVSGKTLLPLAQLHKDDVRKHIDDAISVALHLPTMESIRMLMSREPGLAGHGVGEDEAEEIQENEQQELL
jgi:hypothetical protein